MKRIAISGFSAAALLLLTGPHQTYGQARSPSFQYVVTVEGGLRGSLTRYTAQPGSSQLIYFSNERSTVAATIKVEDIRNGVARVTVRARSFPGKVNREASESALKSAQVREYTYVPMEKLSLPIDGGGALSLMGAIADEAGNLSKPIAPYPVETEAGTIALMLPVFSRGDRVLANLKLGAGTGSGLRGNPAIVLYAPAEGLFVFALQPFKGAGACKVILGRAECTLDGKDYTLLSARPITGGDQKSRIWVLRVPDYIPSRTGVNWRDDEAAMRAGELSQLLSDLRVPRHP